MNSINKTLWMGNIESWMDSNYLTNLFKKEGVSPIRITVKNREFNRGCAFLEFETHKEAEEVLKNFNGIKLNNLEVLLNWFKPLDDSVICFKTKKFTLFVGNIDKTIKSDEISKYFKDRYSSIISVKLIENQQTGKSKGFCFIEFTDYKEFYRALNYKEPIYFGKQRLVFNSAKNKFNDKELEGNFNKENNEENSLLVKSTSSRSNSVTKESTLTTSTNSSLNINSSFLGENTKPNVREYCKEQNYKCEDIIIKQIKMSLFNMSLNAKENEQQSSLFQYYCLPFKLSYINYCFGLQNNNTILYN